MSISFDGVRLVHRKGKGPWGAFFGAAIIAAEIVLTIFLTIAIGAHIFFPSRSFGATGSPQLLSYEGLLTDASGNPLGGTGTQYCFRFSVYDDVSAGTKLWPGGTPATSTATSTDGVFSALIGQADALTYNFYDNDTTYLNVDVYSVAAAGGTCTGGAWQTLSPRQQMTAAGYSISAENVYGALLQTQTANSRVQVGLGSGSPTPIFLGLDVKSTADYIGQSCTTSGTVWYNSAISKALVCENGVIQAVSNSGATTTIAAFTTNTATPATTGTIVFSNANGVTFGINGNTITASVAAGGGNTVSATVFGKDAGHGTALGSLANNSVLIYPQRLDMAVAGSVIKMPVSLSATSSAFAAHTRGYTANFGVYTRHATNSTVLSLHYSTSYTASVSANSNGTLNLGLITAVGNSTSYNTLSASSAGFNITASLNGQRELIMPFNTTLTPGEYWMAFRQSSSSAGAAGALFNISHYMATTVTGNRVGLSTNSTNMGLLRNFAMGVYSVTSGALPGGISMTQVNQLGSAPFVYFGQVTE